MAMAAENISLVQEIDGDNESWKVKVKVLQLWKQTYINNPQVVSSIEMVLIDEQGTRIHATVKRNLIGQFDALLEEGGVRILSKFGVGENTGRFLLTRHPCKINFYRHTSVRLSNDWAGPGQSFQMLAFKDILESNFDFKYSFDVIGEVINCEDIKVMSIKGKERRVKSLQLQNEEGIKLKFALWDEHANKVDAFLADPSRKDVRVILLVQFAKYGEWENEPQISNSMFGSKVWINADLPAFDDFKNSLLTMNAEPTTERVLSSTTVYSNPIDYWTRFEFKNIDELMDIKQPVGCVVVATLIKIQSEHGWYYHACTKCSKKVERLYKLVDENSDDEGVARFECGECSVITDVYPKIKIQVRVQDATGSISFVLFERDVTGYVHKPASQLISNDNNGDHFELFPAEFNMFVGKRFAFKIKVSPYNIDNKYYVYTVNKFSDEDSVFSTTGFPPPTMEICLHYAGIMVRDNNGYEYLNGTTIMICDIETYTYTYNHLTDWINQNLHYTFHVWLFARRPMHRLNQLDSVIRIDDTDDLQRLFRMVRMGYYADIYVQPAPRIFRRTE